MKKSNNKPPQFGYIYLGKGFYLSTDPIGDLIASFKNLKAQLYYLEKIHKDDWTVDRISSALHTGYYRATEEVTNL